MKLAHELNNLVKFGKLVKEAGPGLAAIKAILTRQNLLSKLPVSGIAKNRRTLRELGLESMSNPVRELRSSLGEGLGNYGIEQGGVINPMKLRDLFRSNFSPFRFTNASGTGAFRQMAPTQVYQRRLAGWEPVQDFLGTPMMRTNRRTFDQAKQMYDAAINYRNQLRLLGSDLERQEAARRGSAFLNSLGI